MSAPFHELPFRTSYNLLVVYKYFSRLTSIDNAIEVLKSLVHFGPLWSRVDLSDAKIAVGTAENDQGSFGIM